MTKIQYVSLEELIDIKHGFAFKSDFFQAEPSDYILLTPGNFNVNQTLYFGHNTKYYLGEIPSGYVLDNGDLLVVMTDLTKEMNILGNVVILQSEKKVLHNQRIGLITIKDRQTIAKYYLMYVLNSDSVRKNIKATASGTTVRHTSPKKILELVIPLPTLDEQCKIAEILGAWDDAIALLEKLIAAKRKLKQGLMQQLLTGKKRFKEFEGSEWETVRLKDITTINYGKSPKNIFSRDGQFPVYGTGGITGYTSTHIYDGESVIIGRKGTIDKVRYVSGRFWAIDTTYYLDFRQIVKAKWIYYFLSFTKLELLNEASGVPSLNRDTLYSIKINLPSLPEQEKIASILSSADTEISALEKQLAAYKQQKRGLMQQLLTGKTRVRVN
jgi:type I restriction enzyme, S subunit